MIQKKLIWLVYAAMLIILALYAACIPLNDEGLLHYNSLNLEEAIHAAKHTYNIWNPRIGEMLSYFLGHQAGIWYFFIHTVLGFAAVLFMYRLGTGKWPDSSGKSISVLIFTFVAFLGFNTQTNWLLCNMNWLYPSTIVLGFFCVIENFFKGNFELSTPRLLGAIPLAVVTGMSNDNSAIVAWVLVTGCFLYYCIIKKQAKVTWQYFVLLAVLTTACLVFYLAPGHQARAEHSNWELSFNNIFFNSFLNCQNWLLCLIILWRLLLIGGVLIILKLVTKSQVNNVRAACLFIALFLLWAVLNLAPFWGAPRSFLTFELMITSLLVLLYFQIKLSTLARIAVLLLHCAVMSTHIIPTIGWLAASHREWNRIETMALQARQQGKDHIIVKYSQLDETPTFGRLCGMPGSFFNYRRYPTIPLIATTEENTTHLNHKHKWVSSTDEYLCGFSTGDDIMNPIAAKKLGLKAVYFVMDVPPSRK